MCISAWANWVKAEMARVDTMGGMWVGSASVRRVVIWERLRSLE